MDDLETSFGFLNFELGIQDDQIAGSLSLTKGSFWDIHDASLLVNVDDTNVGLNLSGKTNYGFNLEAAANFNTKDARLSTLSVTIGGSF